MKQNNDDGLSKETREKIVKKVEADLLKREGKPAEAEAELADLANIKNRAREAVLLRAKPIIYEAQHASPLSPNYIHSQLGRANLLCTLLKMYIEELRTLNKEEALFLLAMSYAEFTLNEFV